MRLYSGLLLLSAALAVPALSQDDIPEPNDPESVALPPQPAPNQPEPPSNQRTRRGFLGLLPGSAITLGDEPWTGEGDIDGLDGVDSELRLKYEDFPFIFQEGRPLRISATSLDMDPRVRILRPGSSQPLMDDDDSGRGTNARLTFTPTETGLYIVRVLGMFRGFNGPYRLRIEAAPPLPEPISAEGNAPSETTRWTSFEGELSADDASLDGLHFDDYRVSLAADQELFLRLDSTQFDPVVQIYAPEDREGDYLVSDDDSGPGRNSLLLFRRDTAGDYIIRVTTFSDRLPTGRYTLRVGR
jgi:hypothetical protein